MISRVVPHDQLRAAALEAAHQVLQTAPSARAHVKRMLNERYGASTTRRCSGPSSTRTSRVKGMQAFMEKRPPSWVPPESPS